MVSRQPPTKACLGHDSMLLGTIISLYETQFPGQSALTTREHGLLKAVRRNLKNVFKQLSKVNDTYRIDNPIHALDIRPGLSADKSSKISIVDSPSLLFYYLFDDWYSTYALVAKSKHQYAQQLETLVIRPLFSLR